VTSRLVDWSYLSLYSKIPYLFLKKKRNQRLKASEIRDLQNKKLRALVKHSYDHVPYYHSLFKKANLTPDDIKTVEDIKRIPVSKKVDMINLPIENLTANNVDLRKCKLERTSGTSGIPLSIYRDKQNLVSKILTHYLWQLECGDKITNKRVFLGGMEFVPPSRFIQKLGIFRTKTISPFDIT
jgi:phenylacetate-CoA ligase